MDRPYNLVSIIVPMYNAQHYISKCIKSILDSTYQDLDIILVDDGSTDHTYEQCNQFHDQRIRIIRQANSGVSAARNKGLENAKGNLIVFIDSDDFIGPDFIQNMVTTYNKGYDLVIGGATNIYHDDEYKISVSPYDYDYSKEEFYKAFETGETINYQTVAVWSKIFKKDIIDKNKIRFINNISNTEDGIFCMEYYRYVNSVAIIQESGYYYSVREGSLSHSCNHPDNSKDVLEYYLDFLKVIDLHIEHVKNKNIFLEHLVEYGLLNKISGIVLHHKSFRQAHKRMKLVLEDSLMTSILNKTIGARKFPKMLIKRCRKKKYLSLFILIKLKYKLYKIAPSVYNKFK